MNGVHMNLVATATAMDRFTQAGTTFASEWAGALDSIREAAAELGKGPLGAAFAGMYRAPANATAQRATEAAQVPQRLGAAGLACVEDYRRADEAAARAMPTPGPRPR
ncbi:hypothetical protein LZG04_24835 [Saccharothrix sp. S26]|uniref:hypothetical protein n=1 Tax=Saccharothrix sp. S26 TaxID=2907215 RepID=UPI001F232C5A|nr:hypothetical protein [Saccharothrix sp. S26]MCE6997999.1 hypothetical protein [Saccharothrix sp. S26]